MSFQGPKLEPNSSSAAAASSEPIPRSNSSPQMSLHQSTEPTPQSSEPHVSLSQMKNLITSMFQEFQTTTLPQQVATAVQNAMRISQGQSQSSPSAGIPTIPNPTANPATPFHPSTIVNAVNLGAKVKISTPANFNGARQVNVALWLFEMDQYLTLCGVLDGSQRVAVASSYLKESAFSWWENLCRQSHPATRNWMAFTIALRERFQPLAASRTARAQLHNLRQDSMSVAEYSNKFYSLIQLIPDMSEADQVENYIRGLRNKLAREVDLQDPKVLHAAMTIAQKMETILDNHRHYWRPSHSTAASTTTSTYTSIPSSNYNHPSTNSVAMELGNLNLNDSSTSHSTAAADSEWSEEHEDEYTRYLNEGDNYEPRFDVWDGQEPDIDQEEKIEQLQAMQQHNRNYSAPIMPFEEFTRCMQNRLCLRCKKSGHIARNCPLPRHTPTSSSQPKRNFH